MVQRGSAIRLRKGYQGRSGNFAVLGKTGTGDHRYKVFAPDGTLRESRVVNRTATFAFILGDDFFGTISAFVPGGDAKDYNFTSSLPVELLKQLEPILLPLVDTG